MISKEGLLHHFSALQWQATAQRLSPWLNGLLVVVLAYSLAGLSWRLWPQQSGESLRDFSVTALSSSSVNAKKGQTLDGVASLHLLGVAELPTEKVVQQSVVDAPETRLSLTLRGIIALSSGGVGRALIAEGNAEERLYKVGDTLSGSAVLHEVLADKVILKRGGRFETLTLPRERLEAEVSSAASRGRPASPSGAATTQLRTLRDEIAGNPQLAFSLIQAQPVLEQGKIKGYRVNPGRQRKLFQGTGLRPGDVVTHVNGVALSDPAQMASLFAQFKTADRFELQLERGGQATSLSIDLGQ